MLLPHLFLTPPIEVDPATKIRKKLSPQYFGKSWYSLLKSLPIPPGVMRGGAETMCNQITSIFSKEWHGTTLSMHLTKFRKSKKRKEIRNWSLLMKIISTVPKVLLFKTTDLYNVYLFSEYANN